MSHPLTTLINDYAKHYPQDWGICHLFLDFLQHHPNAADRSNLFGHLTASCWLIRDDWSAFLLLHHKKLDKWIQPGGHADGNTDLMQVAHKEAVEETGLQHLKALSPIPLLLNVYAIPQHKAIPAHFHFDACFAFVANSADFCKNEESHDMAWFDFNKPLGGLEKSIGILHQRWQTFSQQLPPMP